MSRTYKTVADVARANKAAGHHWFDPDTVKFFRSRIESGLIDGRFFISSEQFVASDGEEFPRQYTIREAHEDGSITTPDLPKYNNALDAHARLDVYRIPGA